MDSQFLERLTRLQRSGASFVTATVVSRRAPVSSHLGDRAIVHGDGRMEGFVGGSCSRDIVRRQALEVLISGTPRLVLIRPDASEEALIHAAGAESVVVPMTCASEGAVDIYLEPHVCAPLLLVAGLTPVAEAVAQLGALLERQVVRVVTGQERQDLSEEAVDVVTLGDLPAFLNRVQEDRRARMAAVVASQGHYDEPVLEPLLRAGVGFVGLLSSRKRAVTVRELLELQGLSPSQTARIRNPVGLNLGARTPAEVAVSILAEIIAAERGQSLQPAASQTDAEQLHSSVTAPAPIVHIPLRPGFALSPVDGEEIEMATAVHFAELDGQTYYFTCANCKRRFLKDPQHFLTGQTA
ncbi:XdhC family protein [Deinococcus sp. AJ005]|uniref:XdhC family protein n=1 Tax=Deinococcus sp. AJ005 TaxID=2652443 RepID=UPI00125CC189|nr:XdhC family protein [Deinococcus sp. AJ005]QFP75081.1 YHS domain-containing protein [Deinococcus sp. AJ005]